MFSSIARGGLQRDTAFALVVIAVAILLVALPSGFESPYAYQAERTRALVLEADNSNIQQFGIVKAGSQRLRVRILDGRFANVEVEAGNDLIGKMETDKVFSPGDTAYVVLDVEQDRVISATAYDHFRIDTEALLFALFALLLVGFAGWTGARALLSFVFAVLLLWKVLFPSILMGRDPVFVSLLVVAMLTAVTMTLVAGVGKRALVAILGSLLGLLLTWGLATLLLPPFDLHGAILPFSETLLYSGFAHLNLTRLFVASIFLGASGAVMDLAIDVSASMHEVVQKRPDLSFWQLVQSGLEVGRAMTSTMVTTLLMAYTSGYMALLMVFMAQGTPPVNILNTNYVAAEILRTLVGSFGLVTVAPFTALVGGLLYVVRRPQSEPASQPLAIQSPDGVPFPHASSRGDPSG